MKNFIFNKAFQLGFWIAFVSVVIFNLATFLVPTEARIHHYMNRVGFPAAFYEWGGNPYVERILYYGLIADILIALCYGLLVGSFLSYIWLRDVQNTKRMN